MALVNHLIVYLRACLGEFKTLNLWYDFLVLMVGFIYMGEKNNREGAELIYENESTISDC